MSNNWITVIKYKKKNKTNKSYINQSNTRFTNIKNKPKLNNNVKEKILKYCEIKKEDLSIFRTWKHFYIMGNIKKNNEIFRIEDKLLLLEYINKFKVYKNYNKGTQDDFFKLINKLQITPQILSEEMNKNNLYYNNELLQNHPLFQNILDE